MTTSPDADAPASAWIALIEERFSQKRPVTLRLPGGGSMHLDRPLPFVCVYRHSGNPEPSRAEELVTSQAAYAVARSGKDRQIITHAVRWLSRDVCRRYGAILIVEVWLGEREEDEQTFRPEFKIVLPRTQEEALASTATILEKALGKVRLQQQDARISLEACAASLRPDLPALLRSTGRANVYQLGVEVRPVFTNAESGGVFPLLFQDLRDQVAVALKETFFEFDRDHTTHGSSHFHALGRRAITARVLEADAELEESGSSFEFLLQVTPTNPAAAWRSFQRSSFSKPPEFLYRPLTVDPELVKRRIYSLPLERVKDPTLALLLRRRRDEIDRQLTMLFDRGSPRFLHGSVQLFGGVGEDLLKLAREILAKVPVNRRAQNGRSVAAGIIKKQAEQEIAYYKNQYARFDAKVRVTDKIPPGLMVSGSRLLVGAGTRMGAARVEPILHHEVGTHLLTYFNGATQPLRQMRSGLAGYEELQEGLAIFAEYLSGGLTPTRLRLLAARVVAVRALLDGADFPQAFTLLRDECGLEPRGAFLAAMRVFRGGGFTKDAIYLRGLRDLLDYLRGGGSFARLLVGKIAFDHIPMVEELRERRVIKPPPLSPRYLQTELARKRLEAARRGVSIVKLADHPSL